MAILSGILNDSWKHYRNVEATIARRLKALPKGSVYKRRIGKKTYYYLSVRSGKKVRSRYIGKNVPAELQRAIKERRLLIKQRKDARKNLKILAKALKKPYG